MSTSCQRAADNHPGRRAPAPVRAAGALRDQKGRLPAEKVGKRWIIQSSELPLSEAQGEVRTQAFAKLDAAAEAAAPKAPTQRRFSVRDLRAFQVAKPLLEGVRGQVGAEHPATVALLATLEHLTRGCHRFAWPDKATAYRDARDTASRAVCLLYLEDDPAAELASAIEQELMPALGGLIRRVERR